MVNIATYAADAIAYRASRIQHFPSSNIDDESLELCHDLAKALELGYEKRAGLPLEVVLNILRMSRLIVSAPDMSLQFPVNKIVTSLSSREEEICFISPPIDITTLTKMAQFQVVTDSMDQGFVSDEKTGSWSWFEVCVLAGGTAHAAESPALGGLHPKIRHTDGQSMTWRSHENAIGVSKYASREGRVFDPEHDIWRYLEVGDRICVTMLARFPGWSNIVRRGELRIWEWFEPNDKLTKRRAALREKKRQISQSGEPDTGGPSSDLSASIQLSSSEESLASSRSYPTNFSVRSTGPLAKGVCFITPPFSEAALAKLSGFQVITTSRDYGNGSLENHSWFEISILGPAVGTNQEPHGSKIWQSHSNELAGDDFSKREGQVFDTNHEIWRYIRAGDKICVMACAQYGGSNVVREVELRVWDQT